MTEESPVISQLELEFIESWTSHMHHRMCEIIHELADTNARKAESLQKEIVGAVSRSLSVPCGQRYEFDPDFIRKHSPPPVPEARTRTPDGR